MKRRSVRFTPNAWSRLLVPILLGVLLLGLAATLIVVGLSLLGATAGF